MCTRGAAFDQFIATDAAFREGAISPAQGLVDTSIGRASEGAVQGLRDAIALYVVPDADARGTTLLGAQVRVQTLVAPAIAAASELVTAEAAAWQAAEDARVAAEAEAARIEAEEAETVLRSAPPSHEDSSNSSPSSSSESSG